MRRIWLGVMVVVFAACPSMPVSDGGVVEDAGSGQLLLVFDGDFGEVERFSTASNPARFVNVGEVPAAISRLSVDGDGFSLGPFDERPIEPGASRDVPVFFRPTRNGHHVARISFQATTLPVLASFSMEGSGVGALVQVSAEVDLGSHEVRDGEPVRAMGTARIENVGDRWLYFQDEPWLVTPAEEVCVGDLDAQGRCTGTIGGVDVNAGIAPGRWLDVPIHFASTVPGARTWTLTVRTTLADSPDSDIPVRVVVTAAPVCRLVADVTSIDFGDLEALHTTDRTFTLRNAGGASCDLAPRFQSSSVPAFGVVSPLTWPNRLEPGASLDVTVRAQPNVQLGVQSDSLAFGALEVPVRVKASRPCLEVRGPANLGAWNPNCFGPLRAVTLRNRCASEVRLSAQSSSSAFFVSLPRQTLSGGEALAMQVGAAPLDEPGRVRATWTVDVESDAGFERHTRQVQARMIPGDETERFEAPRKADVLVVHDRSSQALSAARSGLTTLYSQLSASGVDFRLGAVSSSPGGGALLSSSGRKWMTPQSGSDSDLSSLLFGVSGTTGDALGALNDALSAPLATDVSNHRGFFRPNAALVVLFVEGPIDADPALVDALLAYTPDLVVHAVHGCPSALSAGQRALVDATGGTTSACNEPWTRIVKDVVDSANGVRRRVRVSSSVTPGTMAVLGSLPSSWTYSAPWVSLPAGAPSPIDVTFTPACD